MKLSSSNRLVIAMLLVAALAVAFWMLLLSPKRDEASKLGTQVTQLKEKLAQHRSEVNTAIEARAEFPVNYQQLVVLGKAVPGDDDTASLLVQLNKIAKNTKVTFEEFTLEAGNGTEEATPPPAPAAEGSGGTPASLVSPTEVAASTLPLGASIGPAGLDVMPYALTFKGDFFKLADFIKGLDSLVKTENEKLAVNGRLLTVNGFALEADPERPFPALQGKFSVTTYLTPPEQGLTAGATPSGPAPAEATPASTTTGGTP
jgi:Tfp pilus assembly protein PilO